MNRYAFVVLFIATCFLTGCDDHHAQRYQRFVPLGNAGSDVSAQPGPWDKYKEASPVFAKYALALDTKTGKLCTTYEFKIDIDHPDWKDRNIPTCNSLYEKDSD